MRVESMINISNNCYFILPVKKKIYEKKKQFKVKKRKIYSKFISIEVYLLLIVVVKIHAVWLCIIHHTTQHLIYKYANYYLYFTVL